MGGEFVFDAEQHADRATCGPFFSSFLTHGTIISASLGKLLVPQEHLLAMGEAVFEDHVDPMYLCPFKRLLEPGVRAGLRKLSAYQQKSFGWPSCTYARDGCIAILWIAKNYKTETITCEHAERCGRRR